MKNIGSKFVLHDISNRKFLESEKYSGESRDLPRCLWEDNKWKRHLFFYPVEIPH